MKLKEFAVELVNYSPYSKDGAMRPLEKSEGSDQKYPKMDLSLEHEKPAPKRSIDSLNYEDTYRDLINNDF